MSYLNDSYLSENIYENVSEYNYSDEYYTQKRKVKDYIELLVSEIEKPRIKVWFKTNIYVDGKYGMKRMIEIAKNVMEDWLKEILYDLNKKDPSDDNYILPDDTKINVYIHPIDSMYSERFNSTVLEAYVIFEYEVQKGIPIAVGLGDGSSFASKYVRFSGSIEK